MQYSNIRLERVDVHLARTLYHPVSASPPTGHWMFELLAILISVWQVPHDNPWTVALAML